jgi:hypothetical protein
MATARQPWQLHNHPSDVQTQAEALGAKIKEQLKVSANFFGWEQSNLLMSLPFGMPEKALRFFACTVTKKNSFKDAESELFRILIVMWTTVFTRTLVQLQRVGDLSDILPTAAMGDPPRETRIELLKELANKYVTLHTRLEQRSAEVAALDYDYNSSGTRAVAYKDSNARGNGEVKKSLRVGQMYDREEGKSLNDPGSELASRAVNANFPGLLAGNSFNVMTLFHTPVALSVHNSM